jgi:CHASE3 domain sensor protein
MIVNPEKSNAATSFRRVQGLRNIIDVVLFARACCTADMEVVQELQSCIRASPDGDSEMKSQETGLRGYLSSADSLQRRVQNAIDLVRTKNINEMSC